jgi:hypothetical protein
MNKLDPQDPTYTGARNAMRLAGPIVFAIGLIFTIIGLASFFMSFGGFDPPRYFWCAFVGLPLLFVGGGLTQFGFMGAIARYFASQGAPVAGQTFNYLADETKDGVRTIAGAVGEGLRGGVGKACGRCQCVNDADAKFCKSCGAKF